MPAIYKWTVTSISLNLLYRPTDITSQSSPHAGSIERILLIHSHSNSAFYTTHNAITRARERLNFEHRNSKRPDALTGQSRTQIRITHSNFLSLYMARQFAVRHSSREAYIILAAAATAAEERRGEDEQNTAPHLWAGDDLVYFLLRISAHTAAPF